MVQQIGRPTKRMTPWAGYRRVSNRVAGW